MFYVSSIERSKRVAKALKARLETAGVALGYSDCLDAVARMYGHFDHDALTRSIGKQAASPDDLDSDDATVALRELMHTRILKDLGLDSDASAEIVYAIGPTASGDLRKEPDLFEVIPTLRTETFDLCDDFIQTNLATLRAALRARSGKAAALAQGNVLDWLLDLNIIGDEPISFLDDLNMLHEDGFTITDFVDGLLARLIGLVPEELAESSLDVQLAADILSSIPSERAARGAGERLEPVREVLNFASLDEVVLNQMHFVEPRTVIAQLLAFEVASASEGATLLDVGARLAEIKLIMDAEDAGEDEVGLKLARATIPDSSGRSLAEVLKAIAPDHRAIVVSDSDIEDALLSAAWRTLDRGIAPSVASVVDDFLVCALSPDGAVVPLSDLFACAHLQGGRIEHLLEIIPALCKAEKGVPSIGHRDMRGGPWPYLVAIAHALSSPRLPTPASPTTPTTTGFAFGCSAACHSRRARASP